MVILLFGVGAVPMSLAMTSPPLHTMVHTGQLEYLQTILGDRVWHELIRTKGTHSTLGSWSRRPS